jgi:protein TonB
MLKALVNPDGSCGEVLLAKSSGNEFLDKSALNTVAQWKFTPAQSQGKDVAQWVSIPITFSIKRRS